MAIPGIQSIRIALLELAGDGNTHRFQDAVSSLAERFRLTDEERAERMSDGPGRFYRRVGHARRKLKLEGFLENPRRGQFRITERGQRVLKDKPSQLDRGPQGSITEKGTTSSTEKPSGSVGTPEEDLQDAYEILRNSLVADLLDQVMQSSPAFFERLVVDVLVGMGYGGSRKDAGDAIGRSGDEGIDGIIKEDRLGLDIIYIQAKRWTNKVGRPEVQRFAGALQGKRARKGVFITTSSFSREAEDYAGKIDTKVILIGGERLAELMIDHGVGVRTDATYELKRIDADYFPDE